MIQSLKTADLNFYIRQGLNRLFLQPKFVIDQGRAAVALGTGMYFTDRELSPRHRSLRLQPLGFPVDLAKSIKLFNSLPNLGLKPQHLTHHLNSGMVDAGIPLIFLDCLRQRISE